MMDVAVIGAGASGLAALRHLARKPKIFKPVAFEHSSVVGGLWVYREKQLKGAYGHTSIYQNLR